MENLGLARQKMPRTMAAIGRLSAQATNAAEEERWLILESTLMSELADQERERQEEFRPPASEAASNLEVARRMIEKFGPPPPGEGTHPLQRHRDSMG